MGKSEFKARRMTRTYCQTINALPEEVFPLLSPVREAEWLDGWQYTMIYSESGLVEEGSVFTTPHAGEADTVWVVTKHDAKRREVEFTRFTHESRTCVLRIAVRPRDQSSSYVDISYTYTGISPSGNDFINDLIEESFVEDMVLWQDSVNHFLKTGERLRKA